MAATATAPDPRAYSAPAAQSGLVRLFIITAFTFLWLGTAVGALSLVQAGRHGAVNSISPGLAQLHGHLQLFGFVGTLVLGVGLAWQSRFADVGQQVDVLARKAGRLTWLLWTAGLVVRCGWQWRLAVALSGVLELFAFVVFVACLLRMGAARQVLANRDLPGLIALGAFACGTLVLVVSVGESVMLFASGRPVIFPAVFDRRFLLLCTWGFMAPMAWAVSARWLTGLLGLKPVRTRLLIAACALNAAGIVGAIFGKVHFAAVLLLHAAIFVPSALKVFGRRVRAATLGHAVFVRVAYIWLRVAATLGVWASVHDAAGIWGASRHALTVGFMTTLIFVLADWALPRLAGAVAMNVGLTRAALWLLNVGCLIQVFAEIFALQGYWPGAWRLLPLAAIMELASVALFAGNLAAAFTRTPALAAGFQGLSE